MFFQTNQFSFSKTKFIFVVLEPMNLPEVKTSMFRGSFGHIFKTLNCANKNCTNCAECLLKSTCIYNYIFEGKCAEQTTKPYVLVDNNPSKRFFKLGEEVSFSLTLFGKAQEYFPHFLFAFMELAKKGISSKNYKCYLKKVEDSSGKILFYENKLIGVPVAITASQILKEQNLTREKIGLHFLTPLRITNFGDLVVNPSFEMIMKAITRRINSLGKEHCSFNEEINYKFLIEEAKKIEVVSNFLKWKDWSRYSNRQQSKMEFGGLIGKIIFKGDFTPFISYLLLGSHIHIGKNCVFGNGKYIISEEI